MSMMLWLVLHGGGTMNSGGIATGLNNEQPASLLSKTVRSTESLAENQSIENSSGSQADFNKGQPNIRVYLSESQTVETVSLEAYVQGVVAAEMPLDFEPAAMQAQALAARTYIVRKLWLNDRTGVPVGNADVTDTQTHQVYRSLSEMQQLKQEDREGVLKVEEAVKGTKGKIIVYRDEPIEALFFSTSNGFTEDSEEVFSTKLPYLRSVASPWDKEESPRAEETVEMSLEDFYTQLGVESVSVNASQAGTKAIRILDLTGGHRVKRLLVGSEELTGVEVRRRLGLRSAAFDWKIKDNKIYVTTYGSGHGVGMSQWGAEGMAKEGYSARQIIEYYYSGIDLEEVSKLLSSYQ
nr:stage II sporulation protein D [Cohnella sp. WQ 127256]